MPRGKRSSRRDLDETVAYRQNRARDRLLGAPYGKQGHVFGFCCCDVSYGSAFFNLLFVVSFGMLILSFLYPPPPADPTSHDHHQLP